MKPFASAAAFALALCAFAPASAHVRTPRLLVPVSCTVTMPQINFGTYDPTSATSLRTSVDITYSCTGPVSASNGGRVGLSWGAAGHPGARYMLDGRGHRIVYYLCIDPACSEILGDGFSGIAAIIGSQGTMHGNGRVTTGTLTVYAVLPPHQHIAGGIYSDDLELTTH